MFASSIITKRGGSWTLTMCATAVSFVKGREASAISSRDPVTTIIGSILLLLHVQISLTKLVRICRKRAVIAMLMRPWVMSLLITVIGSSVGNRL